MMEDVHIADGIAVKLLLAGIVLAGGVVGTLGLGAVAPEAAADELADGPAPELAFPIDNVTLGSSYRLSMDGKGNDPYPVAYSLDAVTARFPIDNVTLLFPINNVTLTYPIEDVTDPGNAWNAWNEWVAERVGSGIGLPEDATWVLALTEVPDELSQDMDPY